MRPTLLMAVVVSMLQVAAILLPATAEARVIYVDNRIGDDTNDGSLPQTLQLRIGPVHSLRRAGLLVRPGDVIEIANTGIPYRGALRLIGGKASGVPSQPVYVNGNDAVFDGSELVEPASWESLGGDLWRLDPLKKGWYQLVRGDVAVPEAPHAEADGRPLPPRGHWSVWQGAIYYHAEPDEMPAFGAYRLATHEAGIFIYGAHHIVVRNLTLRHYRLDGVNVHDLVYAARLENVVAEANGRSGVFVGGSSEVILDGGALRDNRDAPLLIREKAKVDVRDVDLDAEPVVAE